MTSNSQQRRRAKRQSPIAPTIPTDAQSVIRPQINVLTEAQIHRTHQASLKILSTVGVRVDSARAREIFAQAGRTLVDGERVRIPAALVEQALKTAPPVVEIFDRRGERVFRLGDDRARFGIGVTALFYQDPLTDAVTPFSRRDMASVARLGQALDSFDLISTPGIIRDVPETVLDMISTLEMMANSTKPLSLLISDEYAFPDVVDLLTHLHGNLANKPFIIPYFNPVTPLVMNKGTTDKMLVAIERGLPFMYSNYGMVGATTPITPAGTLAVLNAELLAGLTFSQMVKPGAPIILGMLPAYFDMQGMGTFYDAHSYVINLACAEMMDHYRIPHCGTSGSGMGWGGDLIAAGHQWVNHLTSCLGKIGLAPFVGDNLDAKAFSPVVIVLANEVIAQARRLAHGFAFDDGALVLDEIEAVGPGGNFLTEPTTLRRFRDAYFKSSIWPNHTLESWQDAGNPHADQVLRQHTQDMLDRLQPPEDHDELMARGEAFIQQRGSF